MGSREVMEAGGLRILAKVTGGFKLACPLTAREVPPGKPT
jgi:hypothetical protein